MRQTCSWRARRATRRARCAARHLQQLPGAVIREAVEALGQAVVADAADADAEVVVVANAVRLVGGDAQQRMEPRSALGALEVVGVQHVQQLHLLRPRRAVASLQQPVRRHHRERDRRVDREEEERVVGMLPHRLLRPLPAQQQPEQPHRTAQPSLHGGGRRRDSGHQRARQLACGANVEDREPNDEDRSDDGRKEHRGDELFVLEVVEVQLEARREAAAQQPPHLGGDAIHDPPAPQLMRALAAV